MLVTSEQKSRNLDGTDEQRKDYLNSERAARRFIINYRFQEMIWSVGK
jgi:hypothetical protein